MKYYSSYSDVSDKMLNEIQDKISDDIEDDLPTSVIITNVESQIFLDDYRKMHFEEIFQFFDEEASFQYFKSFRRVRVNFTNATAAANARIQCHQTKIGESVVNCYFAQPIIVTKKEGEKSDSYLQPPSPVRQFLISPPASPPVGWEPVDESQPCINYDLLSALANLTPGEAHELHPPSEEHPGIVVHVCEDQQLADGPRIKIMQTRRPENEENTNDSSPTLPTVS